MVCHLVGQALSCLKKPPYAIHHALHYQAWDWRQKFGMAQIGIPYDPNYKGRDADGKRIPSDAGDSEDPDDDAEV